MASRRIPITVILIFLLSSSLILCCAQTTSITESVRNQVKRLVKSLNISHTKSGNIVKDSLIKRPVGFVERNFTFPGLFLSDASIDNLGHHAGYLPIKHSYNARMFYYFFRSRGKKSDPVVLWLTGGPGCGSEMALFYENGPFRINDDFSLRWNEFGWDRVSNILFVDQPIGTGFSYSSDERDMRRDLTGVTNDLYDFLQAFFERHPEFVKNDFYIAGQSYAGHYIPALASRLQRENIVKEGIHINLKGIAIGNGLTNPEYQTPSYTKFALDNKLISQFDFEQIEKYIPGCVLAIQLCQTDDRACEFASVTCYRIYGRIVRIASNINYYDIRKQKEGPLCYDWSHLEKFLAMNSVKEALGVGNIQFVPCSVIVKKALSSDMMKNYEPMIPPLLEDGIKVLIYAGEFDLKCNWLGNFRWVNAMKWSGHEKFKRAELTTYTVAGKRVGEIKSFGPLTFLKVYEAGHKVSMDQPNVSLKMLKKWMSTQKRKSMQA